MSTVSHNLEHDHGAGRMRGDERREQLIRVALGLFATKGFNGTTTKEIAQAAGVTEALIFRHFPTKEALYEAILRWRMEDPKNAEGLERIRQLAEDKDDLNLIRTLIRAVLSFHRENPDFQRLMFYAALEGHGLAETYYAKWVKPVTDLLVDYVSRRQADGALRDIDAHAAVRAIVSMPLHLSLSTNLFKCAAWELTEEQAVEEFTRVVYFGLLKRPDDMSEANARGKE
jgi:TetR/AcrR family transcriptional regulator